jgi:hypothetical protein
MRHESEALVTIDTNSADDSRGVAFGLSGNLYIPVVAGGLASVMVLTSLLWSHSSSIGMAFVWASLPFGITLGVVKFLFQDKPPHYASDLFETMIGSNCFARHPYGQPTHPLKRAQSKK